jgi:hypothetical protein
MRNGLCPAARLAFCLNWAIMALLTWTAQASAQESAHDKIRKSLVYLEASGKGISGAETGVRKRTQATGFLVSDDGFILTTHHLLSGLAPVEPTSVVIRANVGEKVEVLKYEALPVNAAAELDLLLLKIPPGLEPHKPVKLGTLKEARGALEVYTSGFPKSANYRLDNGTIGSKDTLSAYLWEVNDMPFDFGQSGSPVYTADGTVVGMAKGQLEGAPGVNYMIPIQLADSLLASFRLSDIEMQIARITGPLADFDVNRIDLAERQLKMAMESIEEIASNIDWSASVNGNDIRLNYRKLVSVGPQVEFVAVRVTPIFKRKNGESLDGEYSTDEITGLVPEEFNQKQRLGEVIAPNLFRYIKTGFCFYRSAKEMSGMKVAIAASLKGGIQLAPVVVHLDQVLIRERDCDVNE